jgi:SAM-dependent methyltransferase
MSVCRICGSPGDHRALEVPEVMLGTGEIFPYLRCAACGTVQIREIPDDLDRHYPPDYYAFARPPAGDEGTGLRALLLRRWLAFAATGRGLVGRLLALRWGKPPEFTRWLRDAGVRRDDPILDAGCGDGSLLRRYRRLGFRNLTGADPYLPAPSEEPGLRLVRSRVTDLTGRFRLVMMHHSLEHSPDPAADLAAARRLLAADGRLLVRIPVVAAAFEEYGVHWIQLDAPRHLHVLTRQGFRALAGRTGFVVASERDDSTDFGVWGSEQARAGIPLLSDRSLAVNPDASPFSAEERASFRERAGRWRAEGRGDSAVFTLLPARGGRE